MVNEVKAAPAPAPQVEPSGPRDAPDMRQAMVAEAAYYRAQKRGFTPDHEVDDWLEAEKEIAHFLLSTAS